MILRKKNRSKSHFVPRCHAEQGGICNPVLKFMPNFKFEFFLDEDWTWGRGYKPRPALEYITVTWFFWRGSKREQKILYDEL